MGEQVRRIKPQLGAAKADGAAPLESLAAAIRLALSFPGTYDWFLALRFDVVFFSDFDLSRLNPKLLYFANMCVPQKTTDLGRGGLSRQCFKWILFVHPLIEQTLHVI